MKKDNRTVQPSNAATSGLQNPAVLDSKSGRGKHPNSRKKKSSDELAPVMSVRVFKRQQPATNEEIRAALDFYRTRPD